MMKSGLCLVLLGILALAHGAIYPEYTDDAFEVIWLDEPSFLSQLHHGYNESLLYIYGENHLRLVTTYPNFSVTDNPDADWWQPFLSFAPFHVGTDLWGVGPTSSSDYTNFTEGYTLPLTLVGPNIVQSQRPPGLEGSTFYSVLVNPMNTSDIQAFFVGWLQVENPEQKFPQVALAVVRAHVNINLPYNLRQFYYDNVTDVAYLSYNHYVPYSEHFRPHIHFSNTTNKLVVVDPGSGSIYTISIPNPHSPLGEVQRGHVTPPVPFSRITSSLLHINNNILYVGFAAPGLGNGSVIMVEIAGITVQGSVVFKSRLMSNPRALAFDDEPDILYIGFDGGDQIVRTSYLLDITGYQRVPTYLSNLEAATVGNEHIYFITNDQHSKVIRTRKDNFCNANCPMLGYCDKGKCICQKGYKVAASGEWCEIAPTTMTKKEKGAEAALGVLFGLALVGGTFGWVLYWRGRRGYQAV